MKALKLTGEISGVVGAGLVALNVPISGFGFVAFTASSSAWTYIGWKQGEYSLMRMSLVFTGINLFGVYRWLF